MFDELLQMELKNGETLTYRVSNNEMDKKTIVLIHGNMTSSFHFNLLFNAIGDEYRLIAPDLRGFGGSSYITPINYLSDFADDVAEFLKNLNVSDSVVLGWSTGGGIGMELAIRNPELVSKLILIESVGIMGYPMFRKGADGAPIIGDYLISKEDIAADPVQVQPVLTALANKDSETYRAIWNAVIYNVNQPESELYDLYLQDMLTQRNLVDVDYALVHFNISREHNGVVPGTGEIEKIKIPTLIYQGERDFVVPKDMGEGIYGALKEVATYKTGDFGHSPFIDCFEDLVKDIQAFV